MGIVCPIKHTKVELYKIIEKYSGFCRKIIDKQLVNCYTGSIAD